MDQFQHCLLVPQHCFDSTLEPLQPTGKIVDASLVFTTIIKVSGILEPVLTTAAIPLPAIITTTIAIVIAVVASVIAATFVIMPF